MKDFAGRTAFVTGGANGVGIGIVRNLLNAGCKVAIADIRQNSIDHALAALDNRDMWTCLLRQSPGGDAAALPSSTIKDGRLPVRQPLGAKF